VKTPIAPSQGGTGVTASPDHRVFFALQPDAQAAEAIVRLGQDLRRRHGLKGVLTPAPRLHLPLNFLGVFRGPPTRAVMEKAAGLAAKVAVPPFEVVLSQAESWVGEPRLLVLTGEAMEGVEALHTDIHKALVTGSMAPRREPEHWPHVSLLWDAAGIDREAVDPISWAVADFVMLDSVAGEGRHTVLGRWPLIG
jgi:2'-5' RNA ligase